MIDIMILIIGIGLGINQNLLRIVPIILLHIEKISQEKKFLLPIEKYMR
jgi:hypothetical protein